MNTIKKKNSDVTLYRINISADCMKFMKKISYEYKILPQSTRKKTFADHIRQYNECLFLHLSLSDSIFNSLSYHNNSKRNYNMKNLY